MSTLKRFATKDEALAAMRELETQFGGLWGTICEGQDGWIVGLMRGGYKVRWLLEDGSFQRGYTRKRPFKDTIA